MGDRSTATATADRTTVKIGLDSRDILKMAAARRRMSMVELLAELIAPLADEPPHVRRKPRRPRKPDAMSA